MERTVVVQDILPGASLAALEADADALSDCPNFWVPRDVVEGRAPALTAAEQAVQQLYRRLVKAPLAPRGDAWRGAEYWCQIYEGGRGLGFHLDKDEHAMATEGRMVCPIHSSVLYLTGGEEPATGGVRQAPTVLIDQCYDFDARCVLPEQPGWSALVFPRRNQYCLFSGAQAHGVLEAMPPAAGQQQQRHGRRVTFLVNWWRQRPEQVERATPQDVQAGRLAAARAALGCSPHVGAGAGEGEGERQLAALSLQDAAATAAPAANAAAAADGEEPEAPLRRVEIARVAAPALQPGDVLPIDDLLTEVAGLRLTGPGACDAAVVAHPGLTLVPLDEGAVDPACPLAVLAALMPTADLASESSSSSSSSEEEEEQEGADADADAGAGAAAPEPQ